MLSMKLVNLICIFTLIMLCHRALSADIGGSPISGNSQQNKLGRTNSQSSLDISGGGGGNDDYTSSSAGSTNWLNKGNLQSVEFVATEDSDDYRIIATGLTSKLSTIKTIDELSEFLTKLRQFNNRNNYLITSSFLKDNRPLYLEEHTSYVNPRQYAGYELMASILKSSDARSLLDASRNGDFATMRHLFTELLLANSKQSRSQLEKTLLTLSDKYALLSSAFRRLLTIAQQ